MEKTGLCNGRVWAEGLGGERGQAGTRIVAKSEDRASSSRVDEPGAGS